jgi:hypothetical protein
VGAKEEEEEEEEEEEVEEEEVEVMVEVAVGHRGEVLYQEKWPCTARDPRYRTLGIIPNAEARLELSTAMICPGGGARGEGPEDGGELSEKRPSVPLRRKGAVSLGPSPP